MAVDHHLLNNLLLLLWLLLLCLLLHHLALAVNLNDLLLSLDHLRPGLGPLCCRLLYPISWGRRSPSLSSASFLSRSCLCWGQLQRQRLGPDLDASVVVLHLVPNCLFVGSSAASEQGSDTESIMLG